MSPNPTLLCPCTRGCLGQGDLGLGSGQNLPEKPPGSRVGGPTGFSHRSLGGASAFLASRFRGGINILCDLFWGGTVIFTFGNYGGAQTFLHNENGGTRKFLTDKNNFYTFLRKFQPITCLKSPFQPKVQILRSPNKKVGIRKSSKNILQKTACPYLIPIRRSIKRVY